MYDIAEFAIWGRQTRKKLDTIINKMEEKIEFDDEDYAFIERLFVAYEEGSL
jgi:hypothetical protein